jgi:hypothetical protein
MADSDLKKFKDLLKGVFKVAAGVSAPFDAVDAIAEETFLLSVPADATLAEQGFDLRRPGIVTSCKFTGATALAANGSSYVSLLVQKRDGAGGAAVTVASTDTNTAGANASISAWVPLTVTLTATDANKKFATGNVLTVKLTETGTPTTPIGFFTIHVRYGVI